MSGSGGERDAANAGDLDPATTETPPILRPPAPPRVPEAAPPPPASVPLPAVEPPSPDVALADEATPLPGTHRGGFRRLPTAPIAVTVQSAPAEPGAEGDPPPTAPWLVPPAQEAQRGLAGWALAFSIAGLAVSLFVGWGFPIGLVGVITAILALRRPLESRRLAIWALVVGLVSVAYSAGWLLWAATRVMG